MKQFQLKQFAQRLATEDSGQDLIEYAMVAALIGLGTLAALRGLTNKVGTTFNTVGTSLTNAVS